MRKFRLRNNAVVQELFGEGHVYEDGFIDDYTMVETGKAEHFTVGEYICLSLHGGEKFPTGGEYGEAFDIVEEIIEDCEEQQDDSL